MKKDESGSIVIEATISFVIFVMVLASLISLINIMWLHMRIQTAMTNTVSEISSYTYIYSKANLQSGNDEFKDRAEDTKKSLNELLDALNGFSEGNYTNIGDTIANGNEIYDKIEAMANDPEATIKGFLAWGLGGIKEEGKMILFSMVAKTRLEHYLSIDAESVGGSKMTADQFLKSFGVVGGIEGLNIEKSKFLSNPENGDIIDLVVTYEIKLPMSPIPLKAKMLQRATTYAWMDGDGQHYEPDTKGK